MVVETWPILRSLGFEPEEPDPERYASLDLGTFRLSALLGLNRWFREVVSFGGVLSTSHTIAEISFELPAQVASYEQCIAFIAYYLRHEIDRNIRLTPQTAWLPKGRHFAHLLPWEIEAAERRIEEERFAARTQCKVERPWLKLGLKELSNHINKLTYPQLVKFRFDGNVLTINVGSKVVAMPATGSAWDDSYVISSEAISSLPNRLMSLSVDVSIYEDKLLIDRSSFYRVWNRGFRACGVCRDGSSVAYLIADDPIQEFSRSADGVWASPSPLSVAEINELKAVTDPEEGMALLAEALNACSPKPKAEASGVSLVV